MTQRMFKKVLKTIGLTLADLREKKGYTEIKDFAVKYGLPEVHYWRIENGQANSTLKTLAKILSIHKISLDEFFCLVLKENALPQK